MYYYPGMSKSPYGLPIPPKRKGRPSYLQKFLARQGDLFPAQKLIAGLSTSKGDSHEQHS